MLCVDKRQRVFYSIKSTKSEWRVSNACYEHWTKMAIRFLAGWFSRKISGLTGKHVLLTDNQPPSINQSKRKPSKAEHVKIHTIMQSFHHWPFRALFIALRLQKTGRGTMFIGHTGKVKRETHTHAYNTHTHTQKQTSILLSFLPSVNLFLMEQYNKIRLRKKKKLKPWFVFNLLICNIGSHPPSHWFFQPSAPNWFISHPPFSILLWFSSIFHFFTDFSLNYSFSSFYNFYMNRAPTIGRMEIWRKKNAREMEVNGGYSGRDMTWWGLLKVRWRSSNRCICRIMVVETELTSGTGNECMVDGWWMEEKIRWLKGGMVTDGWD